MTNPFPSNVLNHYWNVGGDQTQAYSSASGDFVPAADAAFTAWLAAGHIATAIDTNANLAAVIAASGAPTPVNATILPLWRTAKTNLLDSVIFKLLFNHENRIRTEVESKVAVTALQYATAIAALL